MSDLLLQHNYKVIKTNPSSEFVLMQLESVDTSIGVTHDFVLSYQIDDDLKHDMFFTIGFPRSLTKKDWIIHFNTINKLNRKSDRMYLLYSTFIACRDFENRTICGLEQVIRKDCLFSFDSIEIETAIKWFIENRSMCPTCNWVYYNQAVKDPD